MSGLRLFLTGFKVGFSKFGLGVSNVINFLLLFVVYFVAVGATAAISKIAGKKFVDKTLGSQGYWISKKSPKQTPETITKMY